MAYFPMFVNLEEQNILIVGGGKTALRKAEKLSYFKPRLHFVSKDFHDETLTLILQHHYSYQKRAFRESDIEDAMMVIAATNDRDVNKEIAKICHERSIPINSVDDQDNCTFFFPSLYTNKEIVCGISSGAHSPVVAQRVRQILETNVPSALGDINERLGVLRPILKQKGTLEKRRAFYHQAIDLMLDHPELTNEQLIALYERSVENED
jgi:siroheme synthase-like protein